MLWLVYINAQTRLNLRCSFSVFFVVFVKHWLNINSFIVCYSVVFASFFGYYLGYGILGPTQAGNSKYIQPSVAVFSVFHNF